MSTILVTGAAGFIGSHTSDQLLRDGHRVVGVDNFRTGRRANLTNAQTSAAFELIEADIATEGVLAAITARTRPDAIIHLAALVSVQESRHDPALNFRLNVEATQQVAEAARANAVPRVVFASSAAIYGDDAPLPIAEDAPKRPISPYGAAKLASEALLLGHAASFGFTVRCQRYFNVYGPRQDPASPYSGVISIFNRRFRAGEAAAVYGDGYQTRDFISVHDVAAANGRAALESGLTSGVANICTGRATSLRDVLAVFAGIFPSAPPPQFLPARAGDILHSLGSPAAAERELGFVARTPLADGLLELCHSAA
jgi:UDP-glucose 4-epimerase